MNNSLSQSKLHSIWLVLKITYGLTCIIAGVDKFLFLLTDWSKYLNPTILTIIPLSMQHFFYLVGIIEILVGILLLTRYTKTGAYLTVGWFALIIINLLSLGTYFDIAIRDAVMAVGAWALAMLS